MNSDTFDLYAWPRCGHAEFFLSEIGGELRLRGDTSAG